METQIDDSVFSQRRAVRPLSIIVIGAGIGGLGLGLLMRKTGHDVREYPSWYGRREGEGEGQRKLWFQLDLRLTVTA